MASVMTEFCEQMDPEILLKMKQAPHGSAARAGKFYRRG